MEHLEQDEMTIDLRELFQIIKKRFLLIVTITLLATLMSAIVSYFILTPTYEASTQILVNKTDSTENSMYAFNDIQTNLKLIETYNVIIKSPRIIDLVIDKYNLNLTSQQLADKVTVSAVKDSQVMSLTVADPSQAEAAKIANAIADTFKEEITKIMKVDNVQILTEAKMESKPSPVKPKPMLNIAIAFVVGLMTSIGIVFLLEYLDTSIKTEQQLEQLLGLPVLASIATIQEDKLKRNRKRNSSVKMVGGKSYEA